MSKFFIDRPIFAWVLAIVTMLAGALAIMGMPVNQYPNIAPPAISISVVYPGASAQTVQDSVVQVIEQRMNGLDGLRYMSSESNSDGSMNIVLTFEQGTDPDIAQVQVQNKLQLATPLLPEEVQRQGIRVAKYQANFMLVVGVVDESGRMSAADLSDYIASNMQDTLARTEGVGDFMLFGSQYAMRIWLDPEQLNGFQLTPGDVANAIRSQNVQVSSGQLGGLPAVEGVQLTATVIGKTRLQTIPEFENILLKVNPDGSQVRLRDVARIDLGAENFSISGKYNGKPSSGMALRLATGGNLLETVERVEAVIAQLESFMPDGLKVVYPYDTSPVVEASISSVVMTLFEAIVLVFLVMYLFLQNFRATLIPTLAVPVVLLGTFGILAAFGFTINVLTMYAMVLAIGLLVDDAIVVVENVERVMVEEKLSAREATRKSMGQIQGALVGIGVVLSVVFIPMAFFGGSAGIIYRQFAITIVSAMGLSVLVALIFTPALCATILKPVTGHGQKKGFFGWFNRKFDNGTQRYTRGVGAMLRHRGRYMFIFLLIVAALAVLFSRIPTTFLPEEDQSILFVQVQLPSNSSAQRTDVVLEEITQHMLNEESGVVESVMGVNGFSFAGRGQNSAIAFVRLKPWEERTGEATDVFSLAQRSNARLSQIKDATAFAFVPPAIIEMGNATGFDFYLQNLGGLTHEELMQVRDQFLQKAAQDPALALVRPNGLNDEPQYQVLIDDEKVRALQLNLSDVNETMSAAWGAMYVNDFVDRGRVKRVFIQGEMDSRIAPEDFGKWYVRNAEGKMVPFSAFATGQWTYGSPKLQRFNGVSAIQIQGQPAPGYSSGEAMQAVERIVSELPGGVSIAYNGLSFEERQTGSQAPMLYALTVLI
ncbi:MAG TPA: efflux RND transporter permease subunit, partial [Pusillimonas sp.]|uniref:efflux RND transporter permease subunit n=1 Tax=Pusillimonas sp. TaxID=3040095 RepID=UPI002B6EFEB7